MARFRYRTIQRGDDCIHEQLVYSQNLGWVPYQQWPCGDSPFPERFPRVTMGGSAKASVITRSDYEQQAVNDQMAKYRNWFWVALAVVVAYLILTK